MVKNTLRLVFLTIHTPKGVQIKVMRRMKNSRPSCLARFKPRTSQCGQNKNFTTRSLRSLVSEANGWWKIPVFCLNTFNYTPQKGCELSRISHLRPGKMETRLLGLNHFCLNIQTVIFCNYLTYRRLLNKKEYRNKITTISTKQNAIITLKQQ